MLHVEIADDAPHRQRARPGFQRVELVGRVAAADQGAHRGADDDVGSDAWAASTWITPIWAKPRAAPLPSTRPIEGRSDLVPTASGPTSVVLTLSSRLTRPKNVLQHCRDSLQRHDWLPRRRQQVRSADMVKLGIGNQDDGQPARIGLKLP